MSLFLLHDLSRMFLEVLLSLAHPDFTRTRLPCPGGCRLSPAPRRQQVLEEVSSIWGLLALLTYRLINWGWIPHTGTFTHSIRNSRSLIIYILLKIFWLLLHNHLLPLISFSLRCRNHLVIWFSHVQLYHRVLNQVLIIITNRNKYSLLVFIFRLEPEGEGVGKM